MDFSDIVLSKEELAALRALAKSPVLVEPHNKDVLYRLKHFELAEIQACSHTVPGVRFPRGAYITDRGRDYLAYLRQQKSDKRRIRHHEIVLYFISATAGSAFTLLVEHFSDIIRFIQRLFQQ